MPKPEGASNQQDLPKLTFSQRLLAALPNLQREKPAPARNGADVVRPDAVIEPGQSGAVDGAGRPSASAKPATTPTKTASASGGSRSDPYPDMSVDELRRAMKYLDPRERRVAMFLGPLLAALDIAIMQVTLHDNPAVGHKGHAAPSTIVTLGVASAVLALVVLVAAFHRRRSFTIFALLFAGYGGGLITMIPSWVAAGWLFIHFNRFQKVVVARTGGAARQRAGRAGANGNASRPRLGSRKEKAPVPTGPAQNKRYTPPKAPGGR